MEELLDQVQALTILEAALDNAVSGAPITVSYSFGDVVVAKRTDGSLDITAELLVDDAPSLIGESPTDAPEHFASVCIAASERATSTLEDAFDIPVTTAIVPERTYLREHLGVQYPTPLERVQTEIDEGRYLRLYDVYKKTDIPLDDADQLFEA